MAHGIEIVPVMYDVNTLEFVVKDGAKIVAEGCRDMREAEDERDAYLAEMHAFNDGPFSAAQCAR